MQEPGSGSELLGKQMPTEIPGVGDLAFFKNEDIKYFGKLVDNADENSLPTELLKERKIMRLLLKATNGTPPMRKTVLRQLTDNDRQSSLIRRPLPVSNNSRLRPISTRATGVQETQKACGQNTFSPRRLKNNERRSAWASNHRRPSKVKRGNMMRVMGAQANADPIAAEVLVESQAKERHDKHVQVNEEWKLIKEEQHAKLVQNQQKDAQKGIL